ncbi:hypothetical protein BSZ39_03575 [Bowdeniella nasicola]|uniref:Amine oxidase domain-containing protein n=1 Tax=Bowdeniella nasicola TaxID=208480 RepID=A0A1Q5Q407_9ACTO|nr:FAD-dependent oxidoreductase [Bowdeniella nasicola]OKL54547.1 hypothetical protein BSZ39_03575 [Bowdeniella nasicola]
MTVVVGGGIAGLIAAWALARAGTRPLLIEARGYTGGLIAGLPVPGTDIVADIGAESFATRGGHVARLLSELDLPSAPPAGRSWVLADDGRAIRIPAGILGIPGSLDDLTDALTDDELVIARADLTMGPDAGADCADLASFVTARLGAAVLDKLVAPVAGGIHSAPPSKLSVDVVAPGLRAATRDHGSLLRAVVALRHLPTPPPVVEQVVGGMHRLTATLAREIEAAGGEIRTRTGVSALRPDGGRWILDVAPMTPARGPELVRAGEPTELAADRVVLACSGPQALDLLATAIGVTPWDMPTGSPIAHLTMLLRAPGLDFAPRGSGMLTAPGAPARAKALTHMSEKWPWLGDALRAELGASHHLVRMSYGRHDEPYPEPTVAAALSDLTRMTGVELTADDILAHRLIRWDGTLAPPTPAHRAAVAALADRLANVPTLAATGAWIAGSGIAAIVPHARAAAEKVCPA